MPKWARVVLRSLGALNCIVLLLGVSFLLHPVYRVLAKNVVKLQDAPDYRAVFAFMTLIEMAFIAVFFFTAIRFVQARLSAANLYSFAVSILIVFEVAAGMVGRIGGFGISIAAASGGVGSGTAPFEFLFFVPFLYPILTVVLVQILKHKYRNSRPNLS